MIKTAIVFAALVAGAGVAASANAQDLASDQAYCRKLVDEYNLGGMGRSFLPQSLDTSVAIDQCRSGNPEPAIPVLQEKLSDEGFQVPPRS